MRFGAETGVAVKFGNLLLRVGVTRWAAAWLEAPFAPRLMLRVHEVLDKRGFAGVTLVGISPCSVRGDWCSAYRRVRRGKALRC